MFLIARDKTISPAVGLRPTFAGLHVWLSGSRSDGQDPERLGHHRLMPRDLAGLKQAVWCAAALTIWQLYACIASAIQLSAPDFDFKQYMQVQGVCPWTYPA